MDLRALDYAQAEEMLAPLSDEQLLAAMAGSSRRIGDTAFSLLQRRGRTDLVIQGLRQHIFRTRDAKVRALNYVLCYGRSVVESFELSIMYLTDRSRDVVETALFGLAHWQDPKAIPHIRLLLKTVHVDAAQRAIAAIESADPKKYSRYFHDSQGVWTKPA
jgi:hypothetical protein